MNTKQILDERGQRYGPVKCQADVAQQLKDTMRRTRNWNDFRPEQKESLEMIAVKISRILVGNPNYEDNWRDIAGYAELVARDLVREASTT